MRGGIGYDRKIRDGEGGGSSLERVCEDKRKRDIQQERERVRESVDKKESVCSGQRT